MALAMTTTHGRPAACAMSRTTQYRATKCKQNSRSGFARVHRAVVDGSASSTSKTEEGGDAGTAQARPRGEALNLRPAGVSDAVVDSQKALEALAKLGGNRTWLFFVSFFFSVVDATTRTTDRALGRLIPGGVAAGDGG